MKIGGVQFILNGIKYDYCFRESIKSMMACCDEVHVLDAGSDDGTQNVLLQMEEVFGGGLKIYLMQDRSLWDSMKGHEKLSYFQNIVMDKAEQSGMDYLLLLQADEVIHQDSISNIRAAAETGKEAFVMNRYNLFKDPYHMLNVEQHRKPCSSEVIRLAKAYRRSYSDGEHIATATVDIYKSLNAIEIFHMGFVRDRVKIVPKIKHMLTEVFNVEMDKRVGNEFKWDNFFNEEDLAPIPKPLPIYVQQWAKERYPHIAL